MDETQISPLPHQLVGSGAVTLRVCSQVQWASNSLPADPLPSPCPLILEDPQDGGPWLSHPSRMSSSSAQTLTSRLILQKNHEGKAASRAEAEKDKVSLEQLGKPERKQELRE